MVSMSSTTSRISSGPTKAGTHNSSMAQRSWRRSLYLLIIRTWRVAEIEFQRRLARFVISNKVLRGFLVPIINTIFIELSTAAYPNISFSPRLILRLNFSFLNNENSCSKPIPQPVSSVDKNQASSSNNRSSENSSNGSKPVFRYRNTR